MDLCATPAVDLARMIRSRELPATELLDAVLARIEAVNPSVNAIVTLAAEQARATAAAAVASGMIPFADGSDLAASVDEVFQVLRAALMAGMAPLLRARRDQIKATLAWNISKGVALTGEQIAAP